MLPCLKDRNVNKTFSVFISGLSGERKVAVFIFKKKWCEDVARIYISHFWCFIDSRALPVALRRNICMCRLWKHISTNEASVNCGLFLMCVLRVCPPGSKQPGSQTNSLTRRRCCFHGQNQQIDCVTEELNAKRTAEERNVLVCCCCCCCCTYRCAFWKQRTKNYNAAPCWRRREATEEQQGLGHARVLSTKTKTHNSFRLKKSVKILFILSYLIKTSLIIFV